MPDLCGARNGPRVLYMVVKHSTDRATFPAKVLILSVDI